MSGSEREGPAEFPPVMRVLVVDRDPTPAETETPVDELTAEQLKREVRALDGLRHPAQLGRVWAAIGAIFAERDGLRGDLVAARAQLETVARERDALHLALTCHAGPMPRMVEPSPSPPVAPEPERMCTACGHGEYVHDDDIGICWADQGTGVLCICTSLLLLPDELDDPSDDAAAAVERAQAGAP